MNVKILKGTIMLKKKMILSPTKIIMLGFFVFALLGAWLLKSPFALRQGVKLEFEDSLFVATSSVCVTGLSTVNIGETFSFFGQLILLFLIQVGGLGVVTFTTAILLVFSHRISLENRMVIQNAYNLETLSQLGTLTKKILLATFGLEGIGALGYAFVFIPEFGIKGIWYSIFHAVSAFCNAGIDLLGGNSFCAYRDNVMINMTTIFLILVSGLGFPVYWEIIRVFKTRKTSGKRGMIERLNIQAKIVLVMTLILFFGGAILTFVFEYNNPDTLGTLNLWQKIQASVFQSTTLRTAGFATIDQINFREVSCLVYLVFMFIGGSPAGTAGGVKTVTVAMLLTFLLDDITGRREADVFKRRVDDKYLRRSVAIITFSFSMLIILTVCLMCVEKCNLVDALYEMTSAIATVGLSRGLTGDLTGLGKMIVVITMYLGRIGPITMALAFNAKKKYGKASYAPSRIIVG